MIRFWRVSLWNLNLLCYCCEQNQGLRESNCRSLWLPRNEMILDCLLSESSSIMCLQVAISLLSCGHCLVKKIFFFGREWCFSLSALTHSLYTMMSVSCIGILGWKWRACSHVWGETWRCRLQSLQAWSNQQPWRW